MIDNINDNQENNLWEENAYIEQKKKSLSKEQEPVCDTTTETKKNVIENECKDTGKEKRVCGCCEKDFLTTSKTKKFCSRSCAASYGNRNFHKSDEHFKNKQKEYRENRKKTKKIILNCENCNTDFQRTEQQYRHINLHYNKKCFCSRRCASDFARKNGLVKYRSRMPTVELQCLWCSKIFYRKLRKIRKHRKIFCSTSCSSKYNTKYRSYARSSLELYVENQLKTLYPTLNIKYNSRFELDSGLELDIFIPSLKLAFEINGKYHYDPIYGEENLQRRKILDNQKINECKFKNINLIVINAKEYCSATKNTINNYWIQIKTVVDQKIGAE